jgi:hypothetical protein
MYSGLHHNGQKDCRASTAIIRYILTINMTWAKNALSSAESPRLPWEPVHTESCWPLAQTRLTWAIGFGLTFREHKISNYSWSVAIDQTPTTALTNQAPSIHSKKDTYFQRRWPKDDQNPWHAFIKDLGAQFELWMTVGNLIIIDLDDNC